MERLEDEAELLRPQPVETADPRVGLAVEIDLARGGPIERAEQVQQGRLAAAAGAHDGHVFAAADVEAHVLQGMDLAVGIELREVLGAEQAVAVAWVAVSCYSWRRASVGKSCAPR